MQILSVCLSIDMDTVNLCPVYFLQLASLLQCFYTVFFPGVMSIYSERTYMLGFLPLFFSNNKTTLFSLVKMESAFVLVYNSGLVYMASTSLFCLGFLTCCVQ